MTILKRLQMLIISYDSLTDLTMDEIEIKNYKKIKEMLSVVLELMMHFQTYKSIDEINTLNKRIGSLKNKIIDNIFNDFETQLSRHLSDESQLIYGCEILDLLGQAYREKLSNWYINNVLKDITTIFKSSEEAGSLDNLKRRFIYFQRILNNFEKNQAKLFPSDWSMNLNLTKSFCELTNKDLKEVTSKETKLNGSGPVDVNLLINSLTDSLDFENYLNVLFKDSGYNFDSSISVVFEPYLNIWIKNQVFLIVIQTQRLC
ncbi:unnamed protein product [Ambrosiozyma monospora]|uniref:Unnamed protein product n=1 Tax=Ambrosiozyma monospora TaxID=43982 RepID=A0ACB5TYG5_AMBMO|nr:unnamed protein product [Ambrosiozyma monospora]